MTIMQPRVVDISHHNNVQDLTATAAAGIWGVIHKASQGRNYRDPDYAARRIKAREAGLLWGAYHFNDGSDVAGQVDWFLKCAAPDASTLLVLDFEDNPKSNMNVQQAVQFLRLLEQKTGRKGAIYSGNRLKETIGQLSAADSGYLGQHRLWLCQYGPRAVMPAGFSHYWLWQYTGDGSGLPPHNVPGIVAGNRGLDLNVYDGDRGGLVREWAGPVPAAEVVGDERTSSHSKQAAADQVDDAEADAAVPAPSPAPPEGEAVQGDAMLFAVQRRLKAMNYNCGVVTGVWGGMTAGAISGFLNDRQSPIAAPTSLDMFDAGAGDITAELRRAEAAHFVRPVSAARKSGDAAVVAAVAPEVVPVQRNFLLTAWTAFGTFIYGIWNSLSGYASRAFDFLTDHKDELPTDPGTLGTAWDYLQKVPTALWIFAAGGLLLFVALSSRAGVKQITQSVQTGARQ